MPGGGESIYVQIGWYHHRLGYTIEEALAHTRRRVQECGSYEQLRDELKEAYENTLHSELHGRARL